MLPVAGRIPDAAMRDRFGERLAFKSRVTDEVVQAEIRKAAVHKQPALTRREMPSFGQVTKAEKGLIWWLVHRPGRRWQRWPGSNRTIWRRSAPRSVLDLALKLNEDRGFSPSMLLERLSMVEAQLVTSIASESEAATCTMWRIARADPKRLRYERERAALQRDRSHPTLAAEPNRRTAAAVAGPEVRLIRRIDGLR